jgi:hypothetical protein
MPLMKATTTTKDRSRSVPTAAGPLWWCAPSEEGVGPHVQAAEVQATPDRPVRTALRRGTAPSSRLPTPFLLRLPTLQLPTSSTRSGAAAAATVLATTVLLLVVALVVVALVVVVVVRVVVVVVVVLVVVVVVLVVVQARTPPVNPSRVTRAGPEDRDDDDDDDSFMSPLPPRLIFLDYAFRQECHPRARSRTRTQRRESSLLVRVSAR